MFFSILLYFTVNGLDQTFIFYFMRLLLLRLSTVQALTLFGDVYLTSGFQVQVLVQTCDVNCHESWLGAAGLQAFGVRADHDS